MSPLNGVIGIPATGVNILSANAFLNINHDEYVPKKQQKALMAQVTIFSRAFDLGFSLSVKTVTST